MLHWLLARNFNGSANQTSDEQVAFCSLGGSLTSDEVATLYNAVHTYLVAVGAVQGLRQTAIMDLASGGMRPTRKMRTSSVWRNHSTASYEVLNSPRPSHSAHLLV